MFLQGRSTVPNSHEQPCEQCHRMLKVAGTVLKEGFCLLSDAFRIVSPTVGYTAEHACRKLLQSPLAAVRIGQASAGNSLFCLSFVLMLVT